MAPPADGVQAHRVAAALSVSDVPRYFAMPAIRDTSPHPELGDDRPAEPCEA